MDWNDEDDDNQALTRIVEMLVALAFLADCVCGRSRPLRRLILSILAPAEAFARNFVIVEARAAGVTSPDLPVSMPAGNSVADAMRLAACFRALAIAVRQLPVRCTRFERWSIPRHRPLRYSARSLLDASRGQALASPRPFDTS